MGRRDKEYFESVEIESIVAEGKAISHVNGKVLFVPYAIPGDIVDIQLNIKRKSYLEGYVVNMIKPSPFRIEPFCSHYGICGGCKWQPLPYPMQLEFKQKQVIDQLTRIGKLNLPEITAITGSDKTQLYRNKLEFTFSNNRWIEDKDDIDKISQCEKSGLGFHISRLFDKVLDVKWCYLQPEPSNAIRLFIRGFSLKHGFSYFDLKEQTGFLRNMVIRTSTTGEVMLIIIFAHENLELRELLLNAIIEQFPSITSINYVINSKRNDNISDLPFTNYYGKDSIYETMENLKFKIGPKSFYQTNSEQAYKLYSIVREYAALKGDEIVYDLYTGTGTIAQFLASKAKKVIGIEYVPEAIEDAKTNARENNISNCLFFAGDMKDLLKADFIKENGRPDVVILDPPRAGIHPDVAKVIVEAKPDKIIYISCNPASQARDLSLMSDHYDITRIHPVDMFPHTHHVENVVLMELKSQKK
ncbi:MAG: 23S rRNA (uracil(1939)-C(5))-methyltransferase RlmD [Rikenellaceae bacterium]